MSEPVDPRRVLVWNLFVVSVQEALDDMREAWMAGQESRPLLVKPPTSRKLEVVDAVMRKVRSEGIADALGPLVSLCDNLDNMPSKPRGHKAYRQMVEEAYKAVLQLKASAKGDSQ
jgi:hypothetical protein